MAEQMYHEFDLPSGKKIRLKEPGIRTLRSINRLLAEADAAEASLSDPSSSVSQVDVTEQMFEANVSVLSMLLVKIDDTEVNRPSADDLDDLLSAKDFTAAVAVASTLVVVDDEEMEASKKSHRTVTGGA